MGEIMLTTGNGFEGYEVVEYLGFVNGQIALSSNFFKDLFCVEEVGLALCLEFFHIGLP